MNRKLQQQLAGYLLAREVRQQKRQSETVPLTKANQIGIVYDATRDSDYELIKNYVRDLMKGSKDVVALGYLNSREIPQNRFMKLGLDFFSRKSVNWRLKPSNAIVTNFINRNFDILIGLNTEHSIPIRYVTAMTKARFKIGKYDQACMGIFDFMIKTETNGNMQTLIQQVDHYLNLIRNEKQ